MASDVNAILMARDGRRKADHELHTAIFASQGVSLPPLVETAKDPASVKGRVKAMLRAASAERDPGGAKQQAR